jgi:hypothetical protein
VASEMKKFVDWFNKQESKLNPVEFAALTKKTYLLTPLLMVTDVFRVLLMNQALMRNEYSIALIPAVLRHEYIACLELAHNDDTVFKEFIADRVIAPPKWIYFGY